MPKMRDNQVDTGRKSNARNAESLSLPTSNLEAAQHQGHTRITAPTGGQIQDGYINPFTNLRNASDALVADKVKNKKSW